MARIIETATGSVERAEVDPVTLDLIENGLRNARHEMDEVLFRTALSPGIREQHDEFPLIADPDGKMVVGQFGLSIPDFLDGFDGTIEEGDVLMTSDPYACGAAISHANDWLVVLPIFFTGRVVGWAAMFGHMTDVGGEFVPAGVYDRARLRAGDLVRGPAIVTEMDSTTLVLPGHQATVHASGSLLITPEA